MADVHEPAVRSYNMSRIRGKDTKPELIVRRFLFSKGFRYRLHAKDLPGRPDIVLPKWKTVIFVHGCFWHGHSGCKYFVVPQTRREWWLNKISGNKRRDSKNVTVMKSMGLRVLSIFECELKPTRREGTLTRTLKLLRTT